MVCAFRRCEASRRRGRGFGEVVSGRGVVVVVVREVLKWVRRVWRCVVFVRRVVLSDIFGAGGDFFFPCACVALEGWWLWEWWF